VLAWISGPEVDGDVAAFADKAHSFTDGEAISKGIELLNDSREAVHYHCQWTAVVDGQKLGGGQCSGSIPPAGRAFEPITFIARASKGVGKAEGEIELEVVFDTVKEEDTFAFRVFGASTPPTPTIEVADPDGATTSMLRFLGYAVTPWDGRPDRKLLVVGRNALSGGKLTLASLEPVVMAGQRVLVMEQDPQWIRTALAMRVSHQLARQVFRIDPAHPVAHGLDNTDLSDWAGSSTLVDPYPQVTKADESSWGYPTYGWHWGNRAAVSSAAIEKPHKNSWRPILECGFDCAFTPLMEMDYGKGRLTLCTLDLEDHVEVDAAAARLARNVLEYASTAPLSPKAAIVTYVGGDAWAKSLTNLGVAFTRSATVPTSADLLIVDPDAGLDDAAVESLAQSGANVLVLPTRTGTSAFGVKYAQVDGAHGSTHVPVWSECRGLSESDLHVRAPHNDWLLSSGAEVGADGLLAQRIVGKGLVVFTQTDPDRFEADRLTYFRFSRWRQTRALAQVLSNMGATFAADAEFFGATQSSPAGVDAGPYYPDYVADFPLGDDPDRYYRW